MKKLLIYLFLVSSSGCNSNDNKPQPEQSSSPIVLDTNVAPITTGSWYRPPVSVTWQWQLEGNLNTSYSVALYDVDLFDTSNTTIKNLQQSGIKVVCYFSAGSYEDYRDDRELFLPNTLGNTLDGWDNERWLDIRSANVHSIMKKRLDIAKNKGCDGVEPDNMDGYTNNSGFNLTSQDQLAYNRFIANEAHKRGLAVGLKNDLDQIGELVEYFDFAVNEQCFEYNECDALLPFINHGKPVLTTEYLDKYVNNPNERATICQESRDNLFSTLILPLDLNDSFRFSCL
ncbi:endo alpha-1,4 polygalactosaminidase [Vibrio sp. 10N.261.52.A1]|uniref:endo alpha-1,4 polygalactosaminidase n=1 Tax=Vibrio TaxID=662 RepID=UPI000C858461|nr:endo alpha-1,4 polygalactosaminidase [Vibrio sp. 10N.261.52.A1]PML42208.1 endo alpha-1,4 polygalactosaminidase [Vibrio sp. 10N.261.52.A1]